MRFPTVLGLVVVFIVWFAYRRRRSAILEKKDAEGFWDKESTANSVRKKGLDELDFIYVHPDKFPFMESDDEIINQCQKTITRLSETKIVNLTGITNTELKFMYGAPNLNILAEYDDNFTDLVRALNIWGKRLFELGFEDESIYVLEFAVTIKSDISETYKTLYKLYNKSGTLNKIQNLIDTAESLNSINKKVILNYLSSTH